MTFDMPGKKDDPSSLFYCHRKLLRNLAGGGQLGNALDNGVVPPQPQSTFRLRLPLYFQ